MSNEALLERARALLLRTMTFYRDDPRTSTWLRERSERLDQPLRIAVSGRVKSGKSTLINALIGTELAPTDAEERTQVPTVYQYGPEPKIMVHTPHGAVQNVPTSTLDATTIRDLQHWRPDEVARLVIESPTPGLQAITLIETPGVASAAVQENGRAALAQILSESDAVLYLTRYPRQADLQFLQSVNELQTARSVPISTIVAFSRADETGSGGPEALTAAEKTAEKFRGDPTLRSFAQHFIPVVGLLGQAASEMTEDDFKVLVFLSRLSDNDRETLLLSAERFVKAGLEAVPSPVRQKLLEKFGHFGISRCLELLRGGVQSMSDLQQALVDESGMQLLRQTLHEQFVERQDALRARSALLAVDMVLRANARPGVHVLHAEFERLLTNAHEWNELRLLSALDSGQVRFSRPLQAEAKRLLGGSGQDPRARLGLAEDALTTDLADGAAAALNRWRQQAVNPALDRVQRDAVRTVVRSCERLILHQAQGGQQQPQPAQPGRSNQAAQQPRSAQQPHPVQPNPQPAQGDPAPRRQAAAQRSAQPLEGQWSSPAERTQQAEPARPAERPTSTGGRRRVDDGDAGTGRRRRADHEVGTGRPGVEEEAGSGRRAATDGDTGTGRRRRADDGDTGTGRRRRSVSPDTGRRRLQTGQSTGSHAKPDPDEARHFVDPTPSGRHYRD
ncbi:dynamin family protein [Saccharopolyspora griseoalba]|uniref:Dynamin family protein n=1 Tax=Saccharopolyspora griseoalba TaxID=1431848 RepID=A0ABW2LJ06_9PSEU